MKPNPHAVVGGNNPPVSDEEIFADLQKRLSDFSDAGSEWQRKGVKTRADAELLVDFINGTKALGKKAYDQKRKEKGVWEEGAKAVEKRFSTFALAIGAIMDPIQKLINDWHAKEKAAEAARQAQLRLEAKQAADAAEAAREAALRRHDAIGIAEAAEQASAASDALRAAEAPIRVQIKSASGGGRTMAPRVHRRVKINNLRLAFMETMEDSGVIEAIEKALNARIRSKDWDGEIPSGCTIIEEETVV